MANLRTKTIRLAYTRPGLRKQLLPLIKEAHIPIPNVKPRVEGSWFVKQVTATPVDAQSAVITAILEHSGSCEVRQISQTVDDVPGTTLRFAVQNVGGLGADEQSVVVTATLDGNEVNSSGVTQMKLLVDPIKGEWNQDNLVWRW